MNLNGNKLRAPEHKSVIEKIFDRMDSMAEYFQKELSLKQHHIDKQREELERLKRMVDHKESTIQFLRRKLNDCNQKEEGHRQLINKLLGDISRYQNDIEWYKRTYEKRSLLGVIKDKFLRGNE